MTRGQHWALIGVGMVAALALVMAFDLHMQLRAPVAARRGTFSA